MRRAMLVMAVAVMVPATCWGQQTAAQPDTAHATQAVRTIRIEHSKVGAGAYYGAYAGTMAGMFGAHFFYQGDHFGTDLKHSPLLWGAIGGAAVGTIGALIGSDMRWSEERQVPARVGMVPLRGGGMVVLQVRPGELPILGRLVPGGER